MQDCSLDFGGLTAWHASVKPHWCMCHYIKMQAAAETRRQEEHRKVRKSNSMLQSTRSLSVWHVRRVLGPLGSVLLLMLIAYSLWQEQAKAEERLAKAEEEACFGKRSDYLSGSGLISVRAGASGGREAATRGT